MEIMETRQQHTKARRSGIRLQDAVVIALVALVVSSIGIASTLWYLGSRQAAGDGARMLQSGIASRIEDHIQRFVAIPHEINEANAAALQLIDRSQFGPADFMSLLLRQIRIFQTVSSIYVGSPEGGLLDAGREGAGGPLYVIETEGFRAGTFRKYSVDDQGNRGELLQIVPDFDARTRPWYQAAVSAGEATWSDIYVLFSGQDMAIAASHPVYDSQGQLLFVLSSDIFLSQIDAFLRSMDYASSGYGVIIDRQGYVVASSENHSHLKRDEISGASTRIHITEDPSSLIQQAARVLEGTLVGFSSVDATHQVEFKLGQNRYFAQLRPIRDIYGVDWLSLIIIPEADFLGPIVASARTTFLFLAIALTLTIAAGVLFVKRVTRPLEKLTTATHQLREGRQVEIPHSRWIREINDLASSFEGMSTQLNSTLGNLNSEIVERKQAQHTLQESEERLRLYIEKSPLAIFVSDEEGTFLDVNPAACQLTGYTKSGLIGSKMEQLAEREEGEADWSLFAALKETGSASGEFPLYRQDGSELWIRVDAAALSANRFVGFCTDITRRKQTEESLRHQQKMESLGTMARGVAHEINNPLMAMMSYSELLETRVSDAHAREFAQNILREGERIAHIIRNLLSFAREDKGQRHPEDLRSIVSDSLPIVRNAFLRSHVIVQTQLDEDVPETVCSRQQIRQVIVNLLMNARDALDVKYPQYDENKIVHLSVTRVERDGRAWVRTSVQDHGTGMTTDRAERAFDPFFTTRPRDERSGLGLTISFGIVQEHGGEIFIESEPDTGTTVMFDLPAYAPPSATS